MHTNEPPPADSAPSRAIARRRRGSAVLGVLAGWVADIGGTTVFASVALTVIALFVGGGPEGARSLAAFEGSAAWQGFGLVFGMSFTALGGYVAARIANHDEYLVAGLTGLASLATGELLMAGADADGSVFWVRLVALLCSVPAAIGGAWMYRERRNAATLADGPAAARE